MTPKKSIGIVETKYYACKEKLTLENNKKIGPLSIAYETYGELNQKKTNAILVLHALSGEAHAAGFHSDEKNPGWWDAMIGPGKAFDTDKYFVICSNVLGGCKGTTGPSSINPDTGNPYALDFPQISIFDMVKCQKLLVDYLGIDKLLSVVGGSMGGMQALAWLRAYPDKISSVIPIATAIRHSPQQIAFNEVGRQAIMSDSNWKSGDYYGGSLPVKGLAVARMFGHITYMSDISMAAKFGRQKKQNQEPFKFTAADFEVEGYLHYHGDNFVKRFDANSYLYITKAMDNFDAGGDKPFEEAIRGVKAKVLVIAFKSDWLYPAYQSKEIAKACKLSGLEASYCEVNSTYGHDAFLIETEQETRLIEHFLNKVFYAAPRLI
ncbi:MAG: homoserine O-acetyltransferase [Candidatus Omnitrophica bacterium]|nr:homoserine O-acetyltransferase [Candidatus Omnitrophota bacterium]